MLVITNKSSSIIIKLNHQQLPLEVNKQAHWEVYQFMWTFSAPTKLHDCDFWSQVCVNLIGPRNLPPPTTQADTILGSQTFWQYIQKLRESNYCTFILSYYSTIRRLFKI